MYKKNTIRRLLGVMTGKYKVQLFFVTLFILISTMANIAGSFFIEKLIDDYIPQMLLEEQPIFTGLLNVVIFMGIVYLLGVIATFLYNRMMVSVSQGVQKTIRENLFANMQGFPIRYFDTHAHGNIMSLPQLISSIATIFVGVITAASISKQACAIYKRFFIEKNTNGVQGDQ